MLKSKILALATAFVASNTFAQTFPNNPVLAERNETVAEHDARMAWFRDAHFGMFIHWGLYSQAGGFWNGKPTKANNCAEWLMLAGKVQRADYAKLADDFNPTSYNADAWVRAAKAAGMKYIILTAKHHEGFAMFKSAASKYNIVDATPFKRDPIKELAAACRKHGMKLGLYYSQNLDWYHPGGGSGEWDPSHKGSPDKYVDEIVIPQLKEILTNYGEIALLWFDIPDGVVDKSRADRIQKALLAASPRIIINNRLGAGYHGDIETPEQHIPPLGFPGKDWEACMTMNKTWGFAKDDHDWKSSRDLIHNLADITSKGGNYLLNVGPDELGRIPEPSLERLSDIGKWMQTNSVAIHEVRNAGFPTIPDWGRITAKTSPDGKTSVLYAIVFDTPKSNQITFPGLTNTPIKSKILGDATPITAQVIDSTVTINLPESLRDKKDYVIAVALNGAPHVSDAAHANADGSIVLTPITAKTTNGMQAQIPASHGIEQGAEPHLGSWTNNSATATWKISLNSAGKYTLKTRIAAPEKSADSVIEFSTGTSSATLTVKSTGDWKKFTDASPEGVISLPAGESTLTVRVKNRNGEAPCNLGTVTLTPVK